MDKEILEDLVKYSKMSTKNDSYIYKFKVIDNKDLLVEYIKISTLGNEERLKSTKISIEGKVRTVITQIIEQFSKVNKIYYTDFVDVNEDNYVTFRIITDTNDQLTIDELLFDDAYYLKDLVTNLKIDSLNTNTSGIVNSLLIVVIVLLVLLIGILLTYLI